MMRSASTGGVDPVALLALCSLLFTLTVAGYTELKDNRIPNWLTVGALAVAFLVGYMPGGLSLPSSIMGFLVGFFFLFIFYMFGGMGGGDVKLMAAVGAFLGYPLVLNTLVYTAIFGGAMALLVLLWNRNFWHGFFQSLAMMFRLRKPEEEKTPEAEAKMGAVPYGIAIILGTLLTVFLSV